MTNGKSTIDDIREATEQLRRNSFKSSHEITVKVSKDELDSLKRMAEDMGGVVRRTAGWDAERQFQFWNERLK